MQWEDAGKNLKSLENMIACVDVSGSMMGNPMAAAMAITLLVATLSKGPFAGKFISFESDPHWISLRYPKTREEFNQMMKGNGSRNGLGSYYSSTKNTFFTIKWTSGQLSSDIMTVKQNYMI